MTPWKHLLPAIERIQKASSEKKACVGFDGYVDSLFRVIRSRKSIEEYTAYQTITEFSSHLAQAAGRSADMELALQSRRMGGNAPLMAEALACLGADTRCVGAMGYPQLDDVFSDGHIHFTPVSVAESAKCTAFEFDDGKLMFGHSTSLHGINWKRLQRIPGLEQMRAMYRESDLWGIVNWSFLLSCNDVIDGFIRDVVQACTDEENRKKTVFFDLADPTGRPREDILHLFSLLRRLAGHCRVVLGLNLNEALCLASVLELDANMPPRQLARAIRERLAIGIAVIHGLDWAAAAWEGEDVLVQSTLVKHPVISTGGGDNFNAGLCTALLHDLSLEDALAFANMVSSYYVSHGRSAAPAALKEYAFGAGAAEEQ